MMRGDDGWFSAEISGVAAGARYKFRIDDEIDVPDPASAFQPEDVFGPSEVIDHAAYPWRATDWRGRPWHEAVIIETHVGTFTQGRHLSRHDRQARSSRANRHHRAGIDAAGGFRRLRNWGYDGVLWYAPDSAYGRPEDLKALIDEAHLRGLMVFLDVVYNHFGPEGNYLGRYAPEFFTEAHTPWGSAIDYRVPQVRAFAIENALLLAARISFRRAAAGCREQHRRTGRAVAAARSQRRGGRTRGGNRPPHPSGARKRRQPRQHAGCRRKTRRAANTARSGTTTIITPGAC